MISSWIFVNIELNLWIFNFDALNKNLIFLPTWKDLLIAYLFLYNFFILFKLVISDQDVTKDGKVNINKFDGSDFKF